MLKDIIEEWKGKPVEVLLRELYIDENMTIPQVAQTLHISVGQTHRWLREFGIDKQPALFTKQKKKKRRRKE